MKILLLTTTTQGGGAAHAALRLYTALRGKGLQVRLLSLWGDGGANEGRQTLTYSKLARLRAHSYKALERAELVYHLGGERGNLWRLSTASWGHDLSLHPWVQWADVLHIHWVQHGMLSLRGLERLVASGKPICWTLHDLWAVTGLCHLPLLFQRTQAELCPRLALGCGSCPLLGGGQLNDISLRLRRRKLALLQSNVHLLCVSSAERKLLELAVDTSTLGGIYLTPPPLDVEQWGTWADQARSASALPAWYQEGRIYLAVSASRIDDEVKAPQLLADVLYNLVEQNPELGPRLTLVLVGQVREASALDRLPIHQHRLGLLSSPAELASVYAHAHVVLSTSLYETFGQSLTEALATGTPVVAWRAGGPEDIVQTGINGYLAPAYDVANYARGILAVLRLRDLRQVTQETCRRSVERYGVGRSAERHTQIYTEILKRK